MTVAVMSIPEALQHLRDAVARREAAEAEYNRTLEEFRKAAVDAKVAGARVVSIAEAAGISRQRAALLLKGIKAIDG